ncbi:dephospho-CoA kinase [Treponema sp. TIM-1]|uniref:dephospho-CoA kinase n=1 Tax=Treponema sp. TIM-1 TaxID=2898417 RepID=UPI00398019B3
MKKNYDTGHRIIGLTGMYCAGKNYVARILEARGLPVLDVDKLGHQAIEMEKEAILQRFGSDILGKDGAVDRRALGAKVFGSPGELAALEELVHPAANRLTEKWIAGMPEGPCVINAALLHRSVVFKRLDCIIIVQAPVLTRFLRARQRDRLPILPLIRRFKSQREFMSQYISQNADIYRVNNLGYLGICSRFWRRALEHRIDDLLSREGVRR